MKNSYYKIISIIEDIELTESLIHQLNALEEESINETAFAQITRKKRNLVRDLLKEMITANLSFQQFELLYQKIFSYLKTSEPHAKEQQAAGMPFDINRITPFLVKPTS